MIVQEIIDRAEELATGVTMDASQSPLVDSADAAFTILPHAMRYVIMKRAATGKGLSDIVQQHDIEIDPDTGYGTLPDAALPEYAGKSSLPDFEWASYLEHEADFNRFKFDTAGQLCYYGIFKRSIRTNCWPIILGTPGLIATAGSNTIQGDVSAGQVGDRIYCLDSVNGLVCDAIIDSINGTTNFTIAGEALVSTSGMGVPAPGILYDRQRDFLIRTTAGAFTSSVGNSTMAMVTNTLTAADIGRRLRVTSSGVVVVDAMILSIGGTTQVTVGAEALSSHVASIGEVYGAGISIQIPSIPAIPTTISDAIEVSAAVAEDIITTIAAVLRGELPLSRLTTDAAPLKK